MKEEILIPYGDHSYTVARAVIEKKVVYNREVNMYFEYFGDEYLEDGEEVVTKLVVE